MCQYRRLSGAECCILSNGSDRDPLKGSPPSPFIDTRRDGVHTQGIVEVVVFSPNRGDAVVEHCRKYTVGHGVGRGTCPRYRPWSCGDCAGVLLAPAGGVVIVVGCTVFQTWRGGVTWVLQVRVLHIYVRQR